MQISKLPTASEITGAEELAILQSGETKKANIQNLRTPVDAELSETSENPLQNKAITKAFSELGDSVLEISNKKVDKEAGKGLSTNDYTTADKTKLAGVDPGANKTIVDAELSETSENPLQNKAVKLALTLKEDLANKVTEWKETASEETDVEYPSALLVRSSLEGIQSLLIEIDKLLNKSVFRTIRNLTTTSDVGTLEITSNYNGNPFSAKKVNITGKIILPTDAGTNLVLRIRANKNSNHYLSFQTGVTAAQGGFSFKLTGEYNDYTGVSVSSLTIGRNAPDNNAGTAVNNIDTSFTSDMDKAPISTLEIFVLSGGTNVMMKPGTMISIEGVDA